MNLHRTNKRPREATRRLVFRLKPFFSASQTAQKLDLSPSYVRALISERTGDLVTIPSCKFGANSGYRPTSLGVISAELKAELEK